MTRFSISFWLFFASFSGFSQITIGESNSEKIESSVEETQKKKKKVRELDGQTAIYMVANWSNTFRTLTENGDLFGDPLEKRADETSLNTWSFGFGLRNRFHENFFWDGGLAYNRNGEQYLFNGSDTMFAYQSFYNYISMPMRINASLGKDFKWSAGAGLVPQMFSSYRQEQQWKTSTNSSGDETIKTKSGYTSFVLSAVFNVGLTIDFKNNWAVMVSPEARFQLNSSYSEISPYIHKGRSYGVTFGLIRNL